MAPPGTPLAAAGFPTDSVYNGYSFKGNQACLADRPPQTSKPLPANATKFSTRSAAGAIFRPNLDPLGDLATGADARTRCLRADAEAARRFYCGTIGVEFMHIPDRERRRWIAGAHGIGSRAAPDRAAHSRSSCPRRNFRAGSADALSRHQALFARRRSPR